MSSRLEQDLTNQLALMALDERWGFPAPVTEYRFAAPRRWRFDLAWVDQKVACECEGGGWTGGRHTRGAGFEGDLEKYATAQLLGWTVVRVSQRMISSGLALSTIEAALKQSAPA